MFYLKDVTLQFGDRVLLDSVNFMVSPKDIIGLIGRNGCGKSTLLKIIAGDQSADTGKIDIPKNNQIGYLRQFLPEDKSNTILQETCSSFKEYFALKADIQEIESSLENEKDHDRITSLLDDLDQKQLQLTAFPFTNPETEAIKLLKGLGFKDEQMNQSLSTLSGGWQMRIELAKLLLRQPDLLLLDEPTNHLDIESIIWFEKYIANYPGAIILVSHDQDFLSNTANRIIELRNGAAEDYKLPYRKYLVEKEQRHEILRAQYVNQQKVIKEKERTITRFKAKATKTSMAQSMEKQLAKMERVHYEEDHEKLMNLVFPFEGRSGEIVFEGKELAKHYGEKKVFENVSLEILRGDKVAFIGQNGMGKSTLIKIIKGIIEPTKGDANLGYKVITAYYDQEQSEGLDVRNTVLETATQVGYNKTSSEIRSVLGAFMFSGEDVDKKVSVLSGGEKARLALACMIMHPSNFIILDEPTNHLDIYAINVLKEALQKFDGNVLVVSHDREFLKGLSNKTFEFKDGQVKEYLGDIDYVLDKRKGEDLRVYAHQKNKSTNENLANESEQKKPSLTFEERKKLNRQLQYLERDIEKLESSLANSREKMADPEFYHQSNANDLMIEFKKMEEELERKTVEWEKVCDILA